MISKSEFTEILEKWLNNYLIKKYSERYKIKVVIPSSNLSKLHEPEIKMYPGYSVLEFKPDILGILTEKKSNDVEIVLLNRSISAISLKEIGEMHCYSRLCDPKESFIISPKGLPNEVNLLLLNKIIERQVLFYKDNKFIKILGFDIKKEDIDGKTNFPINK